MSNFQSRRRLLDGRWECVRPNHIGRLWPYGYCRPWTRWTAQRLAELGMKGDLAREAAHLNDEYSALADKHHSDGHDSSLAALHCGLEYELDQRLRLEPDGAGATLSGPCRACGVPTSGTATLGGSMTWLLCPKHLDRDTVKLLALAEL